MMPSLESDWDRLDQMNDEEIDYTDIPPLGDEFFANAQIYIPRFIRENFVQLDTDVIAWFKAQTKEYPTLVNLVLRKYMEIQQATAT